MLKSSVPNGSDKETIKKRGVLQSSLNRRRGQSVGPVAPKQKGAAFGRKITERRCQSLSPSLEQTKKVIGERPSATQSICSNISETNPYDGTQASKTDIAGKERVVNSSVASRIMRALATKKREFTKLRKLVIQQQNSLMEHYAAVKDLETRAGITNDDSTDEIRIVSVSGWPAHDLLLLIRDDLDMPMNSEIRGVFGPQVLQQLHAQLNPVPEEVLRMGAEIMARRIDLVNLLRGKHRSERPSYTNNLEWKAKNTEFDTETEKLHRMVAGTVENLKAKLNYCLNLSKTAWIDREELTKKIDKLQKDNIVLQHKYDELIKKENNEEKKSEVPENSPKYQTVCEDLAKEKASREALKEVVAAAESMLRVARAKIATLERQLKDAKTELDVTKKKHKELEQLYRYRESTFDARSKKLLEVSKTGEMTIETLSRQRDALELRVKELREQTEAAEKLVEKREAEEKIRIESLQAKVAEQEKNKQISDSRVVELETKVKQLEAQYQTLKERSVRLVDAERRRCLEYIPCKESEPSDRETEIWKELQATRVALSHAEEELRQSRAEKDSFLNSLSRIAQEGDSETYKDKMATELLDREKKIVKLQHLIEELRDNEKMMDQSMSQYEGQISTLRLEVNRLRNYECYAKEIPYQELQTELLELQMQLETQSRERMALVTAAASRALMLERHERAADLFAKMTRAKRDLEAFIDGRSDPPQLDELAHAEVSRSLTSVCANAAETWSALRAERARVLRLESAVLAQNLQLEREGRVRTQLERRRAMLERSLLRSQHSTQVSENNPS